MSDTRTDAPPVQGETALHPIDNVAHYPRPPALEPARYPVRVVLGGVTIVDTLRAYRVLETYHPPTYYIPATDVLAELVPISKKSICEWKGEARYFNVVAGGKTVPAGAWCYDSPTRSFRTIRGHLAFYPQHMDRCSVDGEDIVPQPGEFYAGWVSSWITGPIKGAPGTNWW